jgi:RepB DNA-primase from phage plasmid
MVGNLASPVQFPTINRKDAERFLTLLDDRTDRFTFQLFDDNKQRKDRRLARVLHGTLDELYGTLVDYSHAGAGVFVTINTTNFKGRSLQDIVEVRAYFADLDGPPLSNVARLALRPDIITETSPHRYHVYYLVCDAPLSEENFKKTQLTLANVLGGDPSVCDLSRVMRLPGFPHQKNPLNPFLTRIYLP